MRSADFSASIARGERSDRLPIGVPTMSSFPGTRRSLRQALSCRRHGALELLREIDQRLRELTGSRPGDFRLIEKESELVGDLPRHFADARKPERAARSLQLVRDEKQLREGIFEMIMLAQLAT